MAPRPGADDEPIADPDLAGARAAMTGGLGLTLLVALAAALVLGAVALRVGLPPMIGYIAAGLAVGPFTPGFVADREQVLALADIGVALLMFSIGLRFSLRELAEVGRMVLVGGPIQMAASIGLGFALGIALGWEWREALFIGAVVSVCSSVVLVKIAGEAALQATLHGRLAFGWSIVQDLVTVVVVVVLSSLGGRGEDPVADLLRSSGLALAFIAAIAIGGSRVFPVLLGLVARLGSREVFIIAVAVLAIGTAFAASLVGVSVALGAFVAGLALADSDLTASVLGEIVPLRELFATLFFVSIGIVVEPEAVLSGIGVVVALVGLIVLAKGLLVAGISLAGGYRPATALLAGGLIAQSGEFSFVLATVGRDLDVVSADTFSLVIGAVVASVVLAGPVYALAGAAGRALDRRVGASRSVEQLPGAAALRRHAVILGYGRVGRTVARTLEARGFAYVAVDADYRLVQATRAAGTPILYGDAGRPAVLDQAGVERAITLVVAIPDALAARQAVGHALARNPRIDVAARAHSEAEELELRRIGVARVIVAEREIGNELLRHALHRFGVSQREIATMLQVRREQ